MKNCVPAINDYDQAIKLQPQNPSSWNSRCWLRALAGQLDQALKDCDESLRLTIPPNLLLLADEVIE
jgi:hypothetical protein